MTSLDAVFVRFASTKLRQYLARIEACCALLSEEQIWWRGAENTNSIGNLCLHLAGNVRQWILHGVAGQEDIRNRDGEFAAAGGLTPNELAAALRVTVEAACAVIERLSAARLGEIVRPQNYEVRVLEAVFHVVEHFGQHTGQIIFAAKLLTGEDMGFYGHLSGTRKPPPPPTGQETP